MTETGLSKRLMIQQDALAATEGKYRCGLAISMGVGKTYIGLQHMQREYTYALEMDTKPSFLVVAPKVAIFQSWKDDAEKFGLAHLLEFMNFTTYLSLSKQHHEYGCIYLDECHSLLYTHEFYLSTFPGQILGLTGTPPRYKNSEKGEMVNTFCPIVYSYITDDAVEDKILNDYKIVVHQLELSTQKNYQVKLKNGGQFTTSEREHYAYWTKRIQETTNFAQQKIFRIMRMKAMMEYKTKENYAKALLDMIHEKCIVFCNTTEQADRICRDSYHSKNPDSEDNLVSFKEGSIDQLSCVLQLSEGVNIPNLKAGIILHAYSNERKSAQRIGRLLRLNPDDKAVIHILMYRDTQDEQWIQEALKDLDPEKISYTYSMID
jgi:superfamily II DNA or RNA helicase